MRFRPDQTRRGFIARLSALAGALIAGPAITARAQAVAKTPAATEGPFYPTPPMRLSDVDNDLVKVAGLLREAGGEIIHLSGRVLDRAGRPRSGVRVEIWQCDVNGKYLHPGDDGGRQYDTGFQGFGHDITGPDGSYFFRTIRPTIYPGRTPHIHVKVLEAGRELLTTQFYLSDHPENARDRIYNRLSETEKAQVTMTFSSGAEAPETVVNLIV